jgi:hypothetical protein
MPNVTVNRPASGSIVAEGQLLAVSGRATGTGGLEPHGVDSVTIRVDDGDPVVAKVTQVPHQPLPSALFTASVPVPPAEGPHRILVTAIDDVGGRASATVVVSVRATTVFPRFPATARPIVDEVQAVAANRDRCASIYLDTLESHGHDELPFGIDWEGEDHHQGLARTHQLSGGSVVFFLSHSETDEGDRGNLMYFRYAGPTEGEHVLSTEPLTVAPLGQLLEIEDQHPCDLAFLPEVGNADAGYLFVAEQRTLRVRVFRWSPTDGLVVQGVVDLPLTVGPIFVFLGAQHDRYLLGVVAGYDGDRGTVHVLAADAADLFPGAVPGALDVSAFRPIDPTDPAGEFAFPVDSRASQVDLVTDSTGQHFLLAYRASTDDDETPDDFVDIHPISFKPVTVGPATATVHIFLRPGKTSFASTGTTPRRPARTPTDQLFLPLGRGRRARRLELRQPGGRVPVLTPPRRVHPHGPAEADAGGLRSGSRSPASSPASASSSSALSSFDGISASDRNVSVRWIPGICHTPSSRNRRRWV